MKVYIKYCWAVMDWICITSEETELFDEYDVLNDDQFTCTEVDEREHLRMLEKEKEGKRLLSEFERYLVNIYYEGEDNES